jgi:hypothetical protein
MPLQSTGFQTPVPADILLGQVTAMDVVLPAWYNEETSLLEVDDEFDVVLHWELTGNSTPAVGGSWVLSLYSDDMDGQGLMTGLIAGPDQLPITGGVSPLKFAHKFTVSSPTPKEGVYKLTAVINHSPTGDPKKLSEMYGYADATPIDIRSTVTESNGGGGSGGEVTDGEGGWEVTDGPGGGGEPSYRWRAPPRQDALSEGPMPGERFGG